MFRAVPDTSMEMEALSGESATLKNIAKARGCLTLNGSITINESVSKGSTWYSKTKISVYLRPV